MNSSATPLMELERVGRVFGDGEAAVHALTDATLRVHQGDYVSIMGPSGSGKSTLLNIMALLDRQTSGTYRFDGVDAQSLPEGRRTGLRANRIGSTRSPDGRSSTCSKNCAPRG